MHNRSIIFGLSILFCLTNFSLIGQQNKNNGKELTLTDQRKFDYYFYEAVSSKAIGDYNEAYDLFKYCLEIDSTNSAVLYELGNYFNSLEQKSNALEYYKKAVAYDKNSNFYYKTSLGSLYLELQQYTEAIEIYESLIAQSPDKVDLYLYLSESYRLDGNLPKAIEALDNVEKMVGLDERISMQKFQLYSALENKTKAYAEFEKYIAKYPLDKKYYIVLGNIYLQDSDKLQDAYAIFNKAKAIDPDDPYVIAAIANYYDKVGRKEDAEKELYQAILSPKLDIDTKLSILGQYIGTIQQNKGETMQANALLDTLIIEHPQEPKLNLMYGQLLMLQDNKKDAQFQFRVYAESNPSDPLGWEQLLRSIPTDSINASIEVCKLAISYMPDNIMFYFYKGVGEYQKEEHNKALSTLLDGISKVSEDDNPMLISEFYGLIGSLYYEKKNSDSAFIAFDKALRYNSKNVGVLNNYSYYLSLEKKDLDRAEKMSRITITAEPTNPTYLDTYGWILFEQEDYVSAKIYLGNAVKYSEEKDGEVSSEVLEHYGDVLYKSNDIEQAVLYWKKAKDTNKSKSKTLDKKIDTKTYIVE